MRMNSMTGMAPDVSGPQPLCCAAFLDLTAEEPTAANMSSIVQIPWLMIEEPTQDEYVEVATESEGCMTLSQRLRAALLSLL